MRKRPGALNTLLTTFAAAVVATFVVLPASASIVLTQDTSRGANTSVHLLNLSGQQGVAHSQIAAAHAVSEVAAFNPTNLLSVDIVYLSPHFSASQILTNAEELALVDFVTDGGRLIIAGDNTSWSTGWNTLAGRFGASYAGGGESGTATVTDFSTGVTNGAGGVVNSFTYATGNTQVTGVTSLANTAGRNKLGYASVGTGEVVFLTDFNTFDDGRLSLADNQALWTNLFDYTRAASGSVPEPASLGLLLGGVLVVVASRRRSGEER